MNAYIIGDGSKMKKIIDLGNLPLVNNLCDTKGEALNAKRFPLIINEYENKLMKLNAEINSDEMFSTYLYRSSVNAPYVKHCEKMWDDIVKYNPTNIIDIGGNDGALLDAFQRKSTKKLNLNNVDASKSFKIDNEQKGINYYNSYWGELKLPFRADIITSTNVFQHNPNYDIFLKGISENLKGRWILEFPYFLKTVETDQFDQIYHEHVYYWLVYPLYNIFKKYGLKIIDISEQDIHGGSLRIVSSNLEADNENLNIINQYCQKEINFNFESWENKIKLKINRDKDFISTLNGNIGLFGAAAKGCVYLNCINMNDRFKLIIDDTKEKQNKFSPGTGLEIMDRSIINKEKLDYIIILAHNFKEHIINSLKSYGFKGKFITMLPDIQII